MNVESEEFTELGDEFALVTQAAAEAGTRREGRPCVAGLAENSAGR